MAMQRRLFFVFFLMLTCLLQGTTTSYDIRYSKIVAGVRALYPDVHDDFEIRKLASRKKIEWGIDFKKALEEDQLEKVKIFFDIGFFQMCDAHLTCAYESKSLEVMRYLLEKRLEGYEKLSLIEKEAMNFFAFVSSTHVDKQDTFKLFDSFFRAFGHYFLNMRFFSNFQAPTCDEQIEDYNVNVTLGWISNPCILLKTGYGKARCDALTKRFKISDSCEKQHVLECARLFKHDRVLRTLHFPQDYASLSTLHNIHFTWN